MKKQRNKNRHIPQRTCVGCRGVAPKKELLRIVRTSEGIQYDPTGKLNGRGAYLHKQRTCWERALKGALAHTLRTVLTDEDRAYFTQTMNILCKDDQDVDDDQG